MSFSQLDIDRWAASTKPFPLPDYLVPTGGCPLADMDDDVLMNAPPHLIAHIQRTAAQGGLQVVSPRQTPFSALMSRTKQPERQLGDHIVGSVSDPTAVWPTLDGADMDFLLPDEPLPVTQPEVHIREKTVTVPLTKAGKYLTDPVLGCLVKGRAVIDVLRRDDVAGGAHEMTELLANAWGITTTELDDLDAFTMGVDGPLLRHAIRTDEVYPVVHTAVHMKRVVSVGASEVSRDLLPDDSAMDWRRMRVFCEAVFLLAVKIEGLPIKYMRASPPPGDPSAAANRRNVMAFLPAPCVAWTYASTTFSIFPTHTKARNKGVGIPREVYDALARYTAVVRPMSYAMTKGATMAAKLSTASSVEMPYGETISQAYVVMTRTLSTQSARGKTAAATVRNLIFEAMEGAPLSVRLRLVRYIKISRDEVMKVFGLSEVPDGMIHKLATKFLQIGELIRLKVVAEAGRRGYSVDAWWSDILSQVPGRYFAMTEGSMGWAKVGLWLLFKEPTDRWTKLGAALNYSALRDAEVRSVGAIPLPAEIGSVERLEAAARAGVRNISRTYSSYYMGVADVGMAMSDVAEMLGKPRTAKLMKEAAYLWVLRARCLRGTNVEVIAKDTPTPSVKHRRIRANPVDLLVKPAPYRAFEAYKTHVASSDMLPTWYKVGIAAYDKPIITPFFKDMHRPIIPAAESTVTKYLTRPTELALDIERAWQEITSDMHIIARTYGAEEAMVVAPVRDMPVSMESFVVPTFTREPTTTMSYFDVLAEMDMDEVEWVEDLCDKLPETTVDMIMEETYESVEDLRKRLLQEQTVLSNKRARTSETVL